MALTDAFGGWLETVEVAHPETAPQYEMYTVAHFVPFFRRLDRITTSTGDAYVSKRLRVVLRSTVTKELSALRSFLAWCEREGLIPQAPLIRSPSKTSTGVPFKGQNRKPGPIVLTEAEAEAVLAHLPLRGRYGILPRDFYTVMWDTALRRGTLRRVRAGRHYRVGQLDSEGRPYLRVTADIDKGRHPRLVPLTARATAALDAVCPDIGLLFGAHDMRGTLKSAAKAAGLPEHKWTKLSNHDFRHSRITMLARTTKSLAGLQQFAGHKHASTTAIYIDAGYEAAWDVIHAAGNGA